MSEDRKQILDQYQGGKPAFLVRSFTVYDRYHEAASIRDWLRSNNFELRKLEVLDYGCGVGDYGMLFLRNHSNVTFYDFPVCLDFVKYRVSIDLENIGYSRFITITDILNWPNNHFYELVIFGEVLEHLDNPLEVLQDQKNAKFIFTSSYPIKRTDMNYWNKSGHSTKARDEQPACLEFLETNFTKVANFGGELNLWQNKNV